MVRAKAKVAEATVPETPSVLVDRLIGLTRVMSPAERESIVAQFAAADLLPASNGATEISEELKERLQKLAPGKRLDQARALRILDVLIEFACSLDQLVWEVWKNIAPKIDHPSRIGQTWRFPQDSRAVPNRRFGGFDRASQTTG